MSGSRAGWTTEELVEKYLSSDFSIIYFIDRKILSAAMVKIVMANCMQVPPQR